MLFQLVGIIAGLGLTFIGIYLAKISYRLLTANRSDFELAREHSPKKLNEIFAGEADTYRNEARDYAVAAGMVVDLDTGRLEPQGKLSKELLDPLL